jgi:CheY-like chemotaxis protein
MSHLEAMTMPVLDVAYDGLGGAKMNGSTAIDGAVLNLRPPPLHVLVVDDSDANRVMVSKMLTSLGMHTTQAANGRDALLHLDRHACDLVLLDVEMPVLDGYATAQQVARRAHRPRIVAMTAHADDAGRARCIAAGMDDTLVKPFRLSSLRQMLFGLPVVTVLDVLPLRSLGQEGLAALRPVLQRSLQQLAADLEVVIAGGDAALQMTHRLRGEASMLGGKRLHHVLSVAEEAVRMGTIVDAAEVRMAGQVFVAAITTQLDKQE